MPSDTDAIVNPDTCLRGVPPDHQALAFVRQMLLSAQHPPQL
ncbi:hypothetical protein [Actinophytocola glycyrrhizae]|uniref:Uncharacterized protein n=1 Tax=Actinophytocola glycyrrhizae TaxID=2044873 RepID=A0ABV9SF42_9PSEU